MLKLSKKYVTHNFNYSTDMNFHNCNDFSENIILFNVFIFFFYKSYFISSLQHLSTCAPKIQLKKIKGSFDYLTWIKKYKVKIKDAVFLQFGSFLWKEKSMIFLSNKINSRVLRLFVFKYKKKLK